MPSVATPLVSVIIPCYAQGQFLADSVKSVLAQSYRNFEIIVVDDGSPDRALITDVLQPFGDTVVCVRQANAGLSGARNAGLRVARGEFVVCLDADDRLLANALQVGVDAFATRPGLGLVWGFNTLIDARGASLEQGPRTYNFDGSYAALLEANTIGPPVGVMFRRSTLTLVGEFATAQRHAEDYELYMRIVRLHGSHCHGTLVGEYRLHDGNMSKNAPGMLIGTLRALECQREFTRHDPALRSALQRGQRFVRICYDAEPRLKHLQEQLQARAWGAAVLSASILLRRYPRLFLSIVLRRVRRSVLSPFNPATSAVQQ